jgi:hypothetical protein
VAWKVEPATGTEPHHAGDNEFTRTLDWIRARHASAGRRDPRPIASSRRRSSASGTTRRQSIPTHASLPACSRPSRTRPTGGPPTGPSLTAAARDGRTIVRAGTEEWLCQGPNQRMARNWRTTCCWTRYPDPKRSPVHETGASPFIPFQSLKSTDEISLHFGTRLGIQALLLTKRTIGAL